MVTAPELLTTFLLETVGLTDTHVLTRGEYDWPLQKAGARDDRTQTTSTCLPCRSMSSPDPAGTISRFARPARGPLEADWRSQRV